jgi:hypothetical protein
MIWLLLLTVAAIAIVIYRRKRRDIYKAYDAMPLGIPRYPLIGHGYIFAGTDEGIRTSALLRPGHDFERYRYRQRFFLILCLYDPNYPQSAARLDHVTKYKTLAAP